MPVEQNKKEQRMINRIEYSANGVIVACDTQEKIYIRVENISPLGIGICMPQGSPDMLGKDVIVVTETLIMYAEVTRQEEQEDGSYRTGVSAKKFTDDVLQYLFDSISIKEND